MIPVWRWQPEKRETPCKSLHALHAEGVRFNFERDAIRSFFGQNKKAAFKRAAFFPDLISLKI